ncbi:NADH-quinone oxidoreductase subunit H [Candidatus Woesearchaeota archaeon]|nr:NADH-quinone oxidoreductase subunit H [Candidatus Woesearchaeota archaeon]
MPPPYALTALDGLIAFLIVAASTLTGLMFLGIDRKLAARLQSRIGPPVIQPVRDLIKLMSKETIVPERAVKWLFNFAPIMALASALLLLLYLPVFDMPAFFQEPGGLVIVLFLLILPALALVIGGFSSGNNYATVGAQRKMVMMLSYEFPFAVIIIALVTLMTRHFPTEDAFSFAAFAQHPVLGLAGPLGIIGLLMLFAMLLISLCAEVVRVPFDAPEADTELAGGIFVEYSGRNYALFSMADAAKMCAFITLVIALFFPYRLSTFVELGVLETAGNALFFLLKFLVLAFFGLTFERIAFSRLKINQATRFFWMISAGISIIAFVFIHIDSIL